MYLRPLKFSYSTKYIGNKWKLHRNIFNVIYCERLIFSNSTTSKGQQKHYLCLLLKSITRNYMEFLNCLLFLLKMCLDIFIIIIEFVHVDSFVSNAYVLYWIIYSIRQNNLLLLVEFFNQKCWVALLSLEIVLYQ